MKFKELVRSRRWAMLLNGCVNDMKPRLGHGFMIVARGCSPTLRIVVVRKDLILKPTGDKSTIGSH
jgi:hypothetical protein